MLLKDNWKPYSLSWERFLGILFVYYILFRLIFPQFAYSLQLSENLTSNGNIEVKYQVLVYLATLLPCIFLIFPLLKKEIKINFKRLFISIFIVIFVGLLLNIIFNLIVTWINGDYVTSENQSGLDELAIQSKWLFLSMSLLLAPILEEIVFRGTIFHFIRERKGFLIAAIISSVLFGFIHVFSSLLNGNIIDFIYLFLYSALGFIFCVVYESNRSIYACIVVHMLYNAYASMDLILS